MKTIVLISCGAKKAPTRTQAQKMYLGDLFKESLVYAKTLTSDENIYILSAEHHLLPLEKEIAPYDKTLDEMSKEERTAWGKKVISEISQVADIENDKFIVLAGRNYIEPIEMNIKNLENPLKGKKIGERLQFLTEILKNKYMSILKREVNASVQPYIDEKKAEIMQRIEELAELIIAERGINAPDSEREEVCRKLHELFGKSPHIDEKKAEIMKRIEELSELINSERGNVVPDSERGGVCRKLHELFGKLPRYRFDDIEGKNELPKNGIYIFFEEGEKFGNSDRIVRVGTYGRQSIIFKNFTTFY